MTSTVITHGGPDKLRVAIHKFSSCDGCQLAILNLGEPLLELAQWVDFIHFAELGVLAPEAQVDVSFVEGSISTPDDLERIRQVRVLSARVVSIGACATAGGIQALRNEMTGSTWVNSIYPHAQFLRYLPNSTAIAQHIRVDFELWGCPITSAQIIHAMQSLAHGHLPWPERESVCLACKRSDAVCVLITQQAACLGPVTRSGCGALCPRGGRACYGCFGPSEGPNTGALTNRFAGFGMLNDEIARRFRLINNAAPAFHEAAQSVSGLADD